MNCPVCKEAVADGAPTCACGEQLTPWRLMQQAGAGLRRRGLELAHGGDFAGAALAFLEAALTTAPVEGPCLVDAARALYHLGRPDDALRWLAHAQAVAPGGNAAAVAEAVRAAQPAVGQAFQPDAGRESQAGKPDLRPLLALGLLPRAKGWFKRRPADALWQAVLTMEQRPHDWPAPGPALVELFQQDPGGLWQYVLGLGHWQRGERQDALKCFTLSINARPPYLNPAAYYLRLWLDDPPGAGAALERLRALYRPGEMKVCVGRLARRLKAAGEAESLRALRSLLAGGPTA